jgi:flagellar hook-basal body complex protein FliE
MNVDAIQPLGMQDEVAPPVAFPAAKAGAGPSFVEHVSEGLQQVNQQLLATQSDLQSLAVGGTASLHEVMIRLEESRISLQLLLQVRNRVLEAYQDVMRMQV